MKLRVVIALLVLSTFNSPAQEIARVEPLTQDQIKRLEEAKLKLEEAQRELERIQGVIAGEHHMAAESYMEWSHIIQFDGSFIVMRQYNYMTIKNLAGNK